MQARRRGPARAASLLPLLASVLLPGAGGHVINRVTGVNKSELTHLSVGGGQSVYLTGSEIGTPFAPSAIFVGINGDARCVPQSFTSTTNRVHCIIDPEGLPPPKREYNADGATLSMWAGGETAVDGAFQDLPLFLVAMTGLHADCWHVGGVNHGCFLRFDLAGTPRLWRVLTSEVDGGSVLRVIGRGIDGGLSGDPQVTAKLYRGSNWWDGGTALGCLARYADDAAVATAHTSEREYACRLEALRAGLAAGPFNLSLHVHTAGRGDAYTRLSTSKRLDVANAATYDLALLAPLPSSLGPTPPIIPWSHPSHHP